MTTDLESLAVRVAIDNAVKNVIIVKDAEIKRLRDALAQLKQDAVLARDCGAFTHKAFNWLAAFQTTIETALAGKERGR